MTRQRQERRAPAAIILSLLGGKVDLPKMNGKQSGSPGSVLGGPGGGRRRRRDTEEKEVT